MSLPSDHYSENNGFQWNGPQENCPIPDVDSCNGKYKPLRVLQNKDWNIYHHDCILAYVQIYTWITIYMCVYGKRPVVEIYLSIQRWPFS